MGHHRLPLRLSELFATFANMHSKFLIVVAGPTAVGKTSLSVELARYYDTAVLSADSRQCYKELPVGTAQPTMEERKGIPHYFIGSHSIFDDMNAGSYETYALQVLEELFREKDIVIVCGGTGLYIDALTRGIDAMPPVDKAIEAEVQQLYEKNGLAWLQEACAMEDPQFWAVAERRNPVRLLRALTFMRTHHTSIIHFRKGKSQERPFRTIKIALELPRLLLYDRINRRVDAMLEQGLLEEVAALFPYRHLKSLSTVGYSDFYAYDHWPLHPEEFQQAIDKVKQHSRNYAKRQLTWFRKDPEYHWFAPDDLAGIIAYTAQCITRDNA